MAFQVAAILYRAGRILQDETHIRWTVAELVDWLNDGLRAIVLHKPNARSSTVIVPLQEGSYQQLPSSYMSLLRVIRNLKSSATAPRQGGRVVQTVNRELLDSQLFYWHDTSVTPEKKEVKHVAFDLADPLAFYVFPPNDGTGFVEAIVSVVPAVVALASPDPEDVSAYTTEVDIPDIYQNVLLSYVLYRAYTKDASFAGDTGRAAVYLQEFANSLQLKFSVEALANPNIEARPAAPNGSAT